MSRHKGTKAVVVLACCLLLQAYSQDALPARPRPEELARPEGLPDFDEILRRFDRNGDGAISRDEWDALSDFLRAQMEAGRRMGPGFPPGGFGDPGAFGGPGFGAPGMGAPVMGAPGFPGPGFGMPGMGGPGFGGPGGGRRPIVAQFDKDGDGRLDGEERAEAREFLKAQGVGRGGPGRRMPFFGPGGEGARGRFEDWIELHNTSGEKVDLSGLYLSDDPNRVRKWMIPEGTCIDPRGYLVIFACGDKDAAGGLHAGFRLSSKGESLTLADRDERGNAILDHVVFGASEADVAFGRFPDGRGILRPLPPTPGKPNGAAGQAKTF